MLRYIAWSLLAAYLLVVGLWPAAVTPVGVVFHGLGVVLAAIPLPVIALAGVAAWERRHRHTPKPATA
jgi:hypothetical protein